MPNDSPPELAAMFEDATDLPPDTVLEADICIVGAGAAGITVARAFRGTGRDILLLEGGGEERSSSAQSLYRGESTGDLGNIDLEQTRIRALGGTTRVWEGYCRPLQPIDFEERDWLPHSGWPIDRDDLDPYYRRAVDTLDLGAHEWRADTVAGRHEQPLFPFDDQPVGTVPYQFSPPTQFDRKYRSELEAADDIDLFLNANLVHVGLNANGDAVDRLECQTPDGTSFRARADTYVLAMGGIENPRILLASDDVHPDGIGNRHDQLGRYFMEHPRMFDFPALLVTRRELEADAYLGHPELTFRDEDRPDGRRAKAALALEVPPRVRRERRLLGLSARIGEVSDRRGRHLTGRDIADTVGLDHDDRQRIFALQLRTEQPPVPESRVTLADDRDALGVPRARLDWNNADGYLDSVRRSLLTIGSGFARAGLGRIRLSTDGNDRLDHAFEGAHHHMGTTRMSESPERGVVDRHGRVHGVSNLYVGGSSVFPTGGYANPTFTIVALAHRLADHLESTL